MLSSAFATMGMMQITATTEENVQAHVGEHHAPLDIVEAHPVMSATVVEAVAALLVEIEAHPLITATVVEEVHRPEGNPRQRVEVERPNEAQSHETRKWYVTTLGVLLAGVVGLVAAAIGGGGAEASEWGGAEDKEDRPFFFFLETDLSSFFC